MGLVAALEFLALLWAEMNQLHDPPTWADAGPPKRAFAAAFGWSLEAAFERGKYILLRVAPSAAGAGARPLWCCLRGPWLRCGMRRARWCERLLRPDPADALSHLDERQGPQRRGATTTEDRLSSLLLAWQEGARPEPSPVSYTHLRAHET